MVYLSDYIYTNWLPTFLNSCRGNYGLNDFLLCDRQGEVLNHSIVTVCISQLFVTLTKHLAANKEGKVLGPQLRSLQCTVPVSAPLLRAPSQLSVMDSTGRCTSQMPAVTSQMPFWELPWVIGEILPTLGPPIWPLSLPSPSLAEHPKDTQTT